MELTVHFLLPFSLLAIGQWRKVAGAESCSRYSAINVMTSGSDTMRGHLKTAIYLCKSGTEEWGQGNGLDYKASVIFYHDMNPSEDLLSASTGWLFETNVDEKTTFDSACDPYDANTETNAKLMVEHKQEVDLNDYYASAIVKFKDWDSGSGDCEYHTHRFYQDVADLDDPKPVRKGWVTSVFDDDKLGKFIVKTCYRPTYEIQEGLVSRSDYNCQWDQMWNKQ